MKIEIKAPSPGESVTQVTIAGWLSEDGSFVEKNDDIAEIESEKATLTVNAPESGTLQIVAAEGQTVLVNEVIAYIETEGEEGKRTTKVKVKKEAVVAAKEAAQEVQHSEGVKATPLAKAMINANRIETSAFSSNEKVRVADVLKLLEPSKKTNDSRGEIRKQMTPLRRKLSERLVSVKNETAMLTTFNEADMSAVIKLRKEKGEEFMKKHGVKLGFMSFFGLAVTKALLEYTNVNSQIDGDDILSFPYVDLGIAVQTDKGLMVPVIRNSQNLDLPGMEKAVFEMAEKARNKKISLDDLKGGTFTITNGGVFGSLMSTPIINPPQAGILGMHNIVERPVAVDGQVVIRPMMYIALSYDHRIIDGRDSVLFLKKVKSLIEEPGLIFDSGL